MTSSLVSPKGYKAGLIHSSCVFSVISNIFDVLQLAAVLALLTLRGPVLAGGTSQAGSTASLVPTPLVIFEDDVLKGNRENTNFTNSF